MRRAHTGGTVRSLSEGGYLARKEPIILLGDTGTGKRTWRLGWGSRLAARGSGRAFTTAAEMVTELMEAQGHSELTRVRNR